MPLSPRLTAPLHLLPKPELQSLEVATSFQIPSIQLVGLAGVEVQEARERVRCAIESSQLEVPKRKVTLNLSPAGVRKSGTGLDLALALGVLSARDGAPRLRDLCAWAELGLDGTLKPVGQVFRTLQAAILGQIPIVCFAHADAERALALQRAFPELAGLEILGARTLIEALGQAQGLRPPTPSRLAPRTALRDGGAGTPRLSHEFGAPTASASDILLPLHRPLARVLRAAVVGRHHLLLLGPRGTGKSHALGWVGALCSRFQDRGLARERLCVAELREPYPEWSALPVRRAGVLSRPQALIGSADRPGECALAHGGVLIADEFPEWPRDSREVLREPMEEGVVHLTTARRSTQHPARFRLAASGNLCPCGGWPRTCRCAGRARSLYRERLSGPILDRIDIGALLLDPPHRVGSGEGWLSYAQVCAEIDLDLERLRQWKREPSGSGHAAELESELSKHPEWRDALEALALPTLRSRHKVARLALTLATLDGARSPLPEHWLEAHALRPESVLAQLEPTPTLVT